MSIYSKASLYRPEIYTGSYWPKITHHYSRTWTYYEMPLHWHSSVEVMYMFMGHCSVFVQEEENCIREVILKSGDFILLDSDVIHRLYVEPDTFCYMLNIEVVFEPHDDGMFTMKNLMATCEAFSQVIKREKPILIGNDTSGELYRALNALQSTYLRVYAQPDNRCIFDAEMAVFLIQLGYAVNARRGVTGQSVHVKKAIRYIENHYDSPLTISAIADYVGVHAAHLQRIFHASMNLTINQYLTRLRIDKASRLLESTEHVTIDEIARLVGFKSRQHFAQRFKELMMISPQEYKREQHKIRRIQFLENTELVKYHERGVEQPGFIPVEHAEANKPDQHFKT